MSLVLTGLNVSEGCDNNDLHTRSNEFLHKVNKFSGDIRFPYEISAPPL